MKAIETMISVVLVDRDVSTRREIRALIDAQPDMQVVGEASVCDEAVALVRTKNAHVVIAEMSSPGNGCFHLLDNLDRQGLRVGLIALADSEQGEDVLRLVHAGASACLRKSPPFEEVVAAVRSVADGGHVLEPSALDAVLQDYTARCRGVSDKKTPALSPRECDVLALIAEGRSSREIAVELHLSHKTVEVHRRRIMVKLRRHKIADLVRYAVREGLVALD